MTLRIKIENPEGEGYEARVREMQLSPNGERHTSRNAATGEEIGLVILKPGESHETYVHDGVMVEVTEGAAIEGDG
jgi:hypothetical protein